MEGTHRAGWEKKMNSSIYAARKWSRSKVSMLTKSLCLQQLSFPLVPIDSVCCTRAARALYNTTLMRRATRCAGKASSTVLFTFILSFQNDFHLPTFFPALSCPRLGSPCAERGHRPGSCWKGDALLTSHGWHPGGLTALAIRSSPGAKPWSTAAGREKKAIKPFCQHRIS